MERFQLMEKKMKFLQDSSNSEKLFFLLFGFLSFLFIWLIFFKIDKSVNSSGEIAPLGKPLIIESRFNGSISSIYAHQGKRVKSGDLLLIVDSPEDQAQLVELENQIEVFKLTLLRLNAQLKLENSFVYGSRDSNYEQQLKLLSSSLKKYSQQLDEVDLEIKSTNEEVNSLMVELDSQNTAIELTTKKFELIKVLVEKKFEGELALLEAGAKKEEALRVKSEISRMLSSAKAKVELLESQKKIITNDFSENILSDIVDYENQLEATLLKLSNLKERINGFQVKSPTDGIVSKFNASFIGQVINSNEVLVEVIPDNTPLIFYAKVRTEDISDIRLGQQANIMLSNMNSRVDDKITGVISFIAPNSTYNDKSDESYFEVRVDLTSSTEKIIPGVTGQASLFIGERTILNYFLDPIYNQFDNSLSE